MFSFIGLLPCSLLVRSLVSIRASSWACQEIATALWEATSVTVSRLPIRLLHIGVAIPSQSQYLGTSSEMVLFLFASICRLIHTINISYHGYSAVTRAGQNCPSCNYEVSLASHVFMAMGRSIINLCTLGIPAGKPKLEGTSGICNACGMYGMSIWYSHTSDQV